MNPPPESSRDLEKTKSLWEVLKIQGVPLVSFWWQVLKEPAQASSCQLGEPQMSLKRPRGWWNWAPLQWGGEKQEKYLLKLCFSPDAEWTMTFRKPYKPDDSSSGESNAQDVKQTAWKYIFIVKRGYYFAKFTFLIHGHWNGVNGLKFHTWISEHLQLQRCQRKTFKACKKSHKHQFKTLCK